MILSVITALVQSYGVHNNLIQMNVGGAIVGLSTHAGNISWQEDTRYILYRSKVVKTENFPDINLFDNINFHLCVYIRDDALVVHSSFTKQCKVFANIISTPSLQDWRNIWYDHIKRHHRSNRYRNWVFIDTVTHSVTVIFRENLEQESFYIRFNNVGKDNFGISLSQELIIKLISIDNADRIKLDLYVDPPPTNLSTVIHA